MSDEIEDDLVDHEALAIASRAVWILRLLAALILSERADARREAEAELAASETELAIVKDALADLRARIEAAPAV
jgi:hypothetical protein